MKKPALLLSVLLVAFFCSPEDESGSCKDPGSCNSCFKIRDTQGNYINGGSLQQNSTHVQWDGKDCNGNPVPCGKYEVEYVYQGRHIVNDLIVSGPEAVTRNTRSACDSLRKACSGFFHEEETVLGITCICCE